ncbi:MAG: response regulator transcription factor [Rhodothermales bacterium]|nr:response regulator transcription factor [Rhodothermales bacterium]
MEPIRLVIADDHALIRDGIANSVSSREDVEVVGIAATGQEAIDLVESLKPDVLLVDIELPDQTGVNVARHLRENGSETYIIALSSYTDRRYVYGMIDIDANGYLLKNEATYDAVYDAIRGVVSGNGEFWMSPSFAERLVRYHISERRALMNYEKLSRRETEVLKFVAEGVDNTTVGGELNISPNTVKNHIDKIKDKLGIRTRAELIAWAWRNEIADGSKTWE